MAISLGNRVARNKAAEQHFSNQSRFASGYAVNHREVLASQRLRYQVFGKEMGAKLSGRFLQLDLDHFDTFCRHILVRDTYTGKVVASTRVLTEENAERAGGFYSSSEFNLDAIRKLPGRGVELGRTCVHADYRNGAVISTLWSAIVEFVMNDGCDYLFGCASIAAQDNGRNARAVMRRLQGKYMTPEFLRVQPRHALPVTAQEAELVEARIPPLIRAYLSWGARAAGEPCWDPDFKVADVFMLLSVSDISPRYARHFMGKKASHLARH